MRQICNLTRVLLELLTGFLEWHEANVESLRKENPEQYALYLSMLQRESDSYKFY